MSAACRVVAGLPIAALLVVLALPSCAESEPPRAAPSATDSPAGAAAGTQYAVLPSVPQPDPASYAQIVGELAVDVGPGIPEADVEALHELMRNSGFQIKAIQLAAPATYKIQVWGEIPQAASEFTVKRVDSGWEIVGDTPWVLISGD